MSDHFGTLCIKGLKLTVIMYLIHSLGEILKGEKQLNFSICFFVIRQMIGLSTLIPQKCFDRQLTFTCSKSTIETLEKVLNYV